MPLAATGVLLKAREEKFKEAVDSNGWTGSLDGAWLQDDAPKVEAVCRAQGWTEFIGFHAVTIT
jgi:hypothetical protein